MDTEAKKRKKNWPEHIEAELATELVEKEYEPFGMYARLDDETREMMDKALGDKTLTEVLYDMREGR